ncbi:MAG: CdaR family protein, partial [Rudaea sp.]
MIFRTLLQQWSSILISLALAVVVWVVATGEENPTREDVFPDPIPIQYTNLPEGLTMSSTPAAAVKVTVRAPAARWQTLRPEDFQAVVDLAGSKSGARSLPITL